MVQMRRDDSGQLMIVAAVVIAVGMAALAFVNYSAMSSDEYAMSSELDDSSLMFENLKVTYGQAANTAYQWNSTKQGAGGELMIYAENLTRWAHRYGYTVILLPENKSDGYVNETFRGRIFVTDGTTTFQDEVHIDLTN